MGTIFSSVKPYGMIELFLTSLKLLFLPYALLFLQSEMFLCKLSVFLLSENMNSPFPLINEFIVGGSRKPDLRKNPKQNVSGGRGCSAGHLVVECLLVGMHCLIIYWARPTSIFPLMHWHEAYSMRACVYVL